MSYLARLAARALGHPVRARLVPRVDSRPRFAADAEGGEDAGGAPPGRSALPWRDARGLPQRAPAASDASLAQPAGSAERAPVEPARRAPSAHPPANDAHGRGARAQSAAAADAIVSELERAVHRTSTTRPAAVPAEFPLPVAPVPSDPRAPNETHAEPSIRSAHTARSILIPAAQREAEKWVREAVASQAAENHGGEPFGAAASAATRARDPALDALGRTPSLRRAEALRHPAAPAEPAAVHVEIGRIEVRIAPPPAPAPRPRAAPEGFERYWRLRNYVDRSR